MAGKNNQKTLGSNAALRRFGDIRELIASPANPTPMVKIGRVIPRSGFELHLKLEWFNPFGSIKDRPALFLLKGMEERGELEGKQLVEPTSGNTGIALAMIGAAKGYRAKLTLPGCVSTERHHILEAFGAEGLP